MTAAPSEPLPGGVARAGRKVRWMAVVSAMFLLAWLGLWRSGGCARGSDVDLRLTYEGTGAGSITELTIVAGADKAEIVQLSPGQSFRFYLFGEGGDTRLYVSYKLGGAKRYWKGPYLGLDTGYRIALLFDELGTIHERHCTLPCWFL